MSLKIRSLIAGDGERFSQLYLSQEPWPLFYPTAFIARSIRLSTTHATQLVHLDPADFNHEQTLVNEKAEEAGVKLLDRTTLAIEYGADLLACLDELRN